ncbi:carboxymuconolactone decarboxylase family protein [Horticoccus luteus]|uniref:Carboxymuconolactone decarboxylase family protein n=1 Tax=Horticoccus luteus TaxID=2862869 RepID=A0A8F9XL62_9BACT|nr:carboxymuconolactone decarboxylase family protein [Horticoccus luteus]QYM78896.1 carboxymuconolactone decarboxylase family protein [Horticoccus luteus]
MKERLNYFTASPKAFAAMRTLEAHVRQAGLDHRLLELVKTRASQINGCAFCLDMHTKDARAAGETEQRLYGLSAWREAPYYTPAERAALAWTEAVTRLCGDDPVPDAVYQEARAHFDEQQLVDLTLAIVAINGWNRLSIAFRKEAGGYQPPARASSPAPL